MGKLKLNTKKEMGNNDKGCCCCCPSYIGVILLAIIEASVLISFIVNIIEHREERETHSENKLVWLSNLTVIVFAVQIIPFSAICIWRKDFWPRLTLFIFQVAAFIYVIILHTVGLAILWPGLCHNLTTSDFCVLVNFFFIILSLVFVVALTIGIFGLICCWNFMRGS